MISKILKNSSCNETQRTKLIDSESGDEEYCEDIGEVIGH